MIAGDRHDHLGDGVPLRSGIGGRLVHWPLFRELRADTFSALTGLMRMESHPSGQLLLLDGEHYESLYIVARGFVSHSQMSVEGREHVLGYLGPGRLLNLVAVLDGKSQPGTLQSVTPVDLYAVPANGFLSLVTTRSDLAMAVARALADDNRRLSETARGLALDPVRKRLAAFLLEYAENSPPQQRWTQDMIAAHIGTVRDVVGRILRDMIQEGLVSRERGQLVIVDREGLRRESGADVTEA
ncbi:MAG: Crp/Fnr family transcriptional regulator [Anaerolineae bacterium]